MSNKKRCLLLSLSLISRIHMVEGENIFSYNELWPPDEHTHKINIIKCTHIKKKLGMMAQATDPSTIERDSSL